MFRVCSGYVQVSVKVIQQILDDLDNTWLGGSKGRNWTVVGLGFVEADVRCGQQSFGMLWGGFFYVRPLITCAGMLASTVESNTCRSAGGRWLWVLGMDGCKGELGHFNVEGREALRGLQSPNRCLKAHEG